jgi:hypothetical protein
MITYFRFRTMKNCLSTEKPIVYSLFQIIFKECQKLHMKILALHYFIINKIFVKLIIFGEFEI